MGIKPETLIHQEDELLVLTMPVGPLQCNCTIIGDLKAKQAIVIDPGGDADEILSILHQHQLKLTRILHTHAHFDHFMASGILREATEAPLALHSADRFLWDNLETQCQRYMIPFIAVPPPDETIAHEQEYNLPHCACMAIHTPGHTPGSTSFYLEGQKLLVAGDTLFRRSIGRTDLWGGDAKQIERSIQKRLYTLDEEATVVTGHGPTTVLGDEMRHNPYVSVSPANAKRSRY
ncbi:MAG: MBL fold metallo-hydrolase [Vampirovibrionales bacterium]|nr:MBL fold metallo-hydrolase [Vampirovibrionales bacterium]